MSETTVAPPGAEHLADKVRPLLERGDETRIEYIRSERWIPYTRATEILRRLEDLLVQPKTHRMPNLLIAGETNNGKTVIVKRFRALHPCVENAHGDGNVLPVLYVQAPPVPDEKRFYNAILSALNAPYKPNENVDAKQAQVFRLLRRVQLQMLVLDEIHHIIAGTIIKQRHFLNVIKYLGNELQIPIVGVGTHDAFNALQTDSQLANRFRPMFLPRWEAGEEWDRLLFSFERRLPLRKPSSLAEPALGDKLLTKSEGWIGELSMLLTDAAVEAIRSGRERIDAKVLDRIEWVPPSSRRHAHRR